MRIGKLAGELGLNPKTIRYYELVGLRPEPERTSGNYRAYRAEDVRRLRFVKAAQRLGLTLDEIREVLGFAERGQPPCGFVRDRLRAEVAAIDARIAELQALRSELTGLEAKAEEPQPAAGGYCPIIHVNQETSGIRQAVKFDPRSRIRNLMSSNRWPRVRARLRASARPFAGRVGGDAPEAHPAGAVLDEHQDIQSLQRHGVHVQEIDGEDPGCLGAQELSPGRARAAGRRIDASGVQDLPDGRWRYGDAELQQFALDPAMAPPGEMLSSTFPRLCGAGDYVNARDDPPCHGFCESGSAGSQQDCGLHRAPHNF